jgi:hypothetical protein
MANLKRKVFSVQGKLNASMVLDVGYIFGSIFGMMLQLQKENEAISSCIVLSSYKRENSKMYKNAKKKKEKKTTRKNIS